jgi:hypothetical protein
MLRPGILLICWARHFHYEWRGPAARAPSSKSSAQKNINFSCLLTQLKNEKKNIFKSLEASQDFVTLILEKKFITKTQLGELR